MNFVITACEHRRAGPIVLALGLAIFAAGIVAVHGQGGGEVRSSGCLVVVAALLRISHCAHVRAIRHGRHHRQHRRSGPVLVELPRREEANR